MKSPQRRLKNTGGIAAQVPELIVDRQSDAATIRRLGHRHDELLCQGDLPAAHHAFHGGTGVPLGGGQGLDHGASDYGEAEVGIVAGHAI